MHPQVFRDRWSGFAMQGDRSSAVLRARNESDPERAGTRALHGLFWRLQSDACVVKDVQDLRGKSEIVTTIACLRMFYMNVPHGCDVCFPAHRTAAQGA